MALTQLSSVKLQKNNKCLYRSSVKNNNNVIIQLNQQVKFLNLYVLIKISNINDSNSGKKLYIIIYKHLKNIKYTTNLQQTNDFSEKSY